MNEETKVVEEVTEETVAEPTMALVMHDENAPIITMRKLLEAGVHFGHHTRKWNPKMGKFIYGARNGIYLIDLAKSAQKIEEAYLALKKIVDENGKVLFVGIKPQVKEVIEEQALRSGSFYITNRWLGGTLTNFKTIQRRIARLRELEDKEADGSFDRLPKKEVALLRKEKEKLAKNLGGIKEMRKLPNAVVVVDPQLEHTAVEEAHKLSIPVFGIADTNADPDVLDFPIPANDDAVRSVKVVLGVLANAVCEANGLELIDFLSENEVSSKPQKEIKVETKVVELDNFEEEKNSESDYDGMTVSDLKKIAKEKGIAGYSTMKKDELIEALK